MIRKQTHKARRNFIVPCLFLSAAVIAAAQPARAQDETVNRLNRLENEIQTLSRAVFKGDVPPPSSSGGSSSQQAALEVRLTRIESEIQTLTGKIEQQGYEIRTLQEKIGAAQSAPAAQEISQLPQPAPATAAPLTEDDMAVPSQDEATSAPSSTDNLGSLGATSGNDPVTMYESAYADMKDKKYADAESGFTAFLNRHGEHSLADNARYWLGETYYARGQYDKAARQFAQAYQKNPKGSKGADNLLKLALSLAASNKKDDACLALTQLQAEYGKTSPPVMARAKKEEKTIGCN